MLKPFRHTNGGTRRSDEGGGGACCVALNLREGAGESAVVQG